MAEPTFNELFALDGAFPNPRASLSHVCDRAASCTTSADYTAWIFSASVSFPTCLAFLDAANPTGITIGHSPAVYPGDAAHPNAALDNKLVVFFGNSATNCIPYVLDTAVFDAVPVRFITNHADHFANIQTDGLTDPITTGTTTTRKDIRRCFILDPQRADYWVNNPFMTYADFLTHAVIPVGDPHLNAGADCRAFAEWSMAALSRDAARAQPLIHAHPQPTGLNFHFTSWVRRTIISKLAIVHPTAAAMAMGFGNVTASIDQVRVRLENAETARAARAAAVTSPRERWGQGAIDLLCRFTRAASDVDLPAIHHAIASYDKRSRDTTTLNLAFTSDAHYLPAVNDTNVPKTTSQVLEWFRTHQLIPSGMELGGGLNPFSIICAGHYNTKEVIELAERQALVEAGTSLSLSDSVQFRTKDGRFPKTYLQAADKLWGFALVIRVYFGDAHPLFTALNMSLTEVCPMILQLESYFPNNLRQGLLVAIKVMLYYQNKVGLWLRRARDTAVGTPVPDPNFDTCAEDLRMQTFDHLPRIPDTWMDVIRVQNPELYPSPERIRGGGGSPKSESSSGSDNAGSAVTHPKPNAGLTKKWKESGLKAIKDLEGKWTEATPYSVPKDGDHDICLKYQLTGKCKKGCARAATHKTYNADMIKTIDQHLVKCGLA